MNNIKMLYHDRIQVLKRELMLIKQANQKSAGSVNIVIF